MSGASSSSAAWWSALEPARAEIVYRRGDPEDLRLGDVVQLWRENDPELKRGQPVLIGFPCDEGVRRNHGRPGAALAPDCIRAPLYRLTCWDGVSGFDTRALGLIDLGNVRVDGGLEPAQQRLGDVIAAVLRSGALPIVLGGGHETAFGHYLGYAAARVETAILNVDAHLDVRPYAEGGHSGSSFRQSLELAAWPLRHGRYVVVGAQRQSVARGHAEYVAERQGRIHWLPETPPPNWPIELVSGELDRLGRECAAIYLTIDSDAFRQADAPGTSAPSPVGIAGAAWPALALRAGASPAVRSIDLVEVNPNFDRDGQTARWAALGVRQFLVGLVTRRCGAAPITT